ncbi:MAG: GNAT family N-acetyltransferase [Lachnospiraceae bacterium]|nr:GNAT family N-acetyltransferase [Lachnospiraceae bacterium]
MSYYLRKTLETDCKLFYRWANDPAVRSASFSTEQIGWEEHQKWFAWMLEKDSIDSFVCMDFLLPVGQVRVGQAQSDPKKGVISYSVGEEYRGRGIAKQMLAKLEEKLTEKYTALIAEVKPENEASRKVFEDLGYTKVSEDETKLVFEKALNGPTVVMQSKKPREAKFEVLRVIAMLMVIMLHYLDKGGLLHRLDGDHSGSNLAFWFLEAFCLVSVNLYVMISGYFLIDSRFTLRRLVKLWCEVFFYSVLVAAICLITGIADRGTYLNFYNLQYFFLPAVNNHYWFASSYLLLYLFSPFLGAAVKKMSKQQHLMLLLTLLCVLSLPKSLVPAELAMDDHGVSILWFLCLYIVAAYIRLHGIPFLQTGKKSLLCYGICAVMIPLGMLMVGGLRQMVVDSAAEAAAKAETFRFGFLDQGFAYLLTTMDDYNHILVLCASVGLFCFFVNWKPKKNLVMDVLARIAPYTFGVYLLHEHLLLRYAWPEWLGVNKAYGPARILHMLLSVLIIFIVGILVDALRSILFDQIEKLIDWGMGIYFAKKEVWDYLIVGFMTTVVAWVTYPIFAGGVFAGMEDAVRVAAANAVSWVFSVIFAYVTNRIFVFHSTKTGFAEVSKEFATFVGARLFSFGVDEGMMLLLVVVLHVNEFLSKYVIVSIAVIVLNYVLSKLLVFKKPAKKAETDEEN